MAEVVFRFEARPSFRDQRGRWAKATPELLREKRFAAIRLGVTFVRRARQEAPKRSGRYARSLAVRSTRGAESVGFELVAPQPLTKWIVEGTEPHDITPRGPGYPLRFFWANGPAGPRYYHFYRVRHPGTKPNPYLDRAHEAWLPDARFEMNKIASRYVTTVVNG